MTSRSLFTSVVFAALALAGCGGGSSAEAPQAVAAASVEAPTAEALAASRAPAVKAASVTLPATTVANLGTSVQVSAQVKDKTGKVVTGTALAWSSADTSIATVNASGLVTPVRAGFTTVTASAGGVAGSGTVSVRGPVPVPVRSSHVGTNLAGLAYYGSEFPFANLIKSIDGWSSRDDAGVTGAAFPGMTSDGYPAALNPGQHAVAAVAWENAHYAAGRYVVLWDGDGAVSVPLGAASVTATSPTRLEVEVTNTSGPLVVSIDRTNPANPLRNLRFLWPGTEATHATQPFTPEFLRKTAPFSVLRFMDWGATNGSPVVAWTDRAQPTDVRWTTRRGIPLETMIELANSLHADPWFCIPHQASDDYVTRFATLLRAKLDPGLRPHIEYSNEVWNNGFAQTAWAQARSDALGLPRPWGFAAAFYAQRSVQVFKLVQQAFGPTDSARLVRVIGGQAAWTAFQDAALGWKDTALNADVLAIAPYFSAGAAADPANADATLALTSEQLLDQMLADVRGNVKARMLDNAALASRYKLGLKAYESGFGDTTGGFPAAKVDAATALFAAANRLPRMRALYAEYYGQWIASGGGTMNQYADIAPWSKWGFWGALESLTQDPATAPKYLGLLDVIAAHPTPP